MKKLDAKEEKRARNEEYAKRFKPKKKTKSASKFANWCRTEGHPSTCRCAYDGTR